MNIDAKGVYYKRLNEIIKESIKGGEKSIYLKNINGQRYIGDGIRENVSIHIDGVPGNDLGAFMDGPNIVVNSNAQDCVGNTMNSGKIIIKGNAGDVIGYAMRGGKIFVKGDIGYRVGIHMKAYKEHLPIIVAGGKAGDFFGEYMAGGILVLLGLNSAENTPISGRFTGTGMHGGVIYLRGDVDKFTIGAEVGIKALDDNDKKILKDLLMEYSKDVDIPYEKIMSKDFIKLLPISHRPYGRLYAY